MNLNVATCGPLLYSGKDTMKILIAEDDLTSRTLLVEMLKRNGHGVVEAVDGAAALDALQQPDAPQLVILDWMMPEMNGIEVVRRIRRMEADCPPYVIMLTIKGEKADIVAGLDAGANDYLTKPFDPGELRARVDVGLRMIEMQAALVARNDELRQALDQIKTLQGILPICASCKKIRDDKGSWNQMEAYISSHSEIEFSHGYCPECAQKVIKELEEFKAR
jgi:CheY-like chemotaxis protein